MGSKERRDRERTELRELILDTARAMFAADGVEAVTMRALAKRIEYSPTAIYLHFKDKDALLQELCAHDLKALTGAVRSAGEGLTGFDRMRAMAVTYVRFALEHREQYQVLFMMPSARPGTDGQPTGFQEAYEHLRDNFLRLIDSGQLRIAREDVDLAAQTYHCSLHGIVANAITTGASTRLPGWQNPESKVRFLVETLIKGWQS